MSKDFQLRFITSLDDNVSGSLNKIQGNLKMLESDFKKIATVGALGFGAITGAIALSVKESIKMEAAQTRLTHILKTATGASDEQVNSLFEQASALEKLGVIGAESIIQAQAQLATFDLQTESIQRLIPAILDYVVAEKGASASTEDLKQLTNGLAQALQGNFASLTKTGFVLDDATKALIENGTEAERTAALVKVLNSTYEGFNEAARQTAEGSLIVLKNEFNNLRQAIGDSFLPILVVLIETITPYLQQAAVWVSQNQDLVVTVTAFALALFGLLTVVGGLGLMLIGVIGFFTSMGTIIAFIASGPVLAIIFAIGALIVIGWKLYQNWDQVMVLLKAVWEDWGGVVKGIINAISFLLEAFINTFIKQINIVIKGLNTMINIANKLPSINFPSIPEIPQLDIPALAEGGIVTRPTLAMIGEAGAEAVIPLNRKRGIMGDVNITITGNTFMSDREAAEKIGDMIIRELKTATKLLAI